jgi:hypothetical protein
MDENREITSAPLASREGRSVKAQSHTTDVATSCGGWGRKGAAGGEHHSGAHAPDSEQEYAMPSDWTVCGTQTSVLGLLHAIHPSEEPYA